jgi:hypothetical protein
MLDMDATVWNVFVDGIKTAVRIGINIMCEQFKAAILLQLEGPLTSDSLTLVEVSLAILKSSDSRVDLMKRMYVNY